MLTRRQLLLSAAVLGMPVTAALPFPHEPRSGVRLGLLQSREPFIDPHDVDGSRRRAFNAYRVLIRGSLEEHGPLDWVAGGAFPLSGPGPFPEGVLARLVLRAGCAEVEALAWIARTNRLQLTLGTWWQEPNDSISQRLITFDRSGRYRAIVPPDNRVSDGVALHMTAGCGNPSLADLSADCCRLSRYGVRIETLCGPAAPPGVRPAMFRGSAFIGPDGAVIAQASVQEETCLVAELG